ncbi:MAG TPA: tetratricopeptide repeat protein [Bryobacteraceae bacterium]|nr:tetratricopeptide repeat protein [Bryobacteraceae bacterium]
MAGLKLHLIWLGVLLGMAAAAGPRTETASFISIDYPADGTVFPPDFAPPTFLWRDANPRATRWVIEVGRLRVTSDGPRLQVGETDPRCVGAVPPTLTPEQAAAHAWKPDRKIWTAIQGHTTVTITGFAEPGYRPVSHASIAVEISRDPVGAPIFYRDVPLIPTSTEKGVIKPLPSFAIGLIGWRLRNVSEDRSRLLMDGLPTCANCHSFSRDGKTLGLDVDGPQNDKGLYALVPVGKRMSIRNEDVIRWSTFRGDAPVKTDGPTAKRFGFMSQVSPDGQYVVTTIEDPRARGIEHVNGMARGLADRFFNAGYQDYTFGQVFYPTRGILAWYSRAARQLQPLPGADDPRYVQTNAVWSPDARYLVFARAEARDPYPPGEKTARYANDPNETQIQYDLYRIPFNDGAGGRAEPVAGASRNGMSNNFPKVSPDGKWIVFVQCRNGLLMRPDSHLYIVPAAGGAARRLKCNTSRMNSWHSFSPNGRWLVFSSKARSPYTQMYLTHIDERGDDSPAILIENATAANRAVNIPEFVNIPPDGIGQIDAPATEFYRLFDVASELGDKKDYEAAIRAWNQALELNPGDAKALSNLGVVLATVGRTSEAIAQYRKAVASESDYPDGYTNLGIALAREGRLDEAIPNLRKAVQLSPWDAKVHSNLGTALAESGVAGEAMAECEKAVQIAPNDADAHADLGLALAKAGRLDEAIAHFERAAAIDPDNGEIHANLAGALLEKGRLEDAVPHFEKALAAQPDSPELHYYLGRLLATLGRFAEALPHLERAAAGGDPAIAGTLAAVYAQVGRLNDALTTARNALRLARERNQADLVRALTDSIAKYQAAR